MIYSIVLYNAIVLTSTVLLYLHENQKSNPYRKIFYYLAFVITVAPVAIRYNIGADYISYQAIFEKIAAGEHVSIEPGYWLLNYIISHVGLSYEWLFAITAIITYIFIFLSYPDRYRWVYHLFFLLALYFQSLNIVRQMMALSMVMYAIKLYTVDGRVLKYYAWMCLAATFHYMAVLYFFVPFTKNGTAKAVLRAYWPLLILISVLAFVLGGYLAREIFDSGILRLFGYQNYISKDLYMKGSAVGTGLGVLAMACFLAYPLTLMKRWLSRPGRTTIPAIIILAYLICWGLEFNVEIFYRARQLFLIAVPMAAVTVMTMRNAPFRIAYIMCGVIYFSLMFNTTLIGSSTSYRATCNSNRLYPYVTTANKGDSDRDVYYKYLCNKL